ncbi:MAG: hypothetical protein WBM83_03475 [Flavobacteriaceae bacterium]
MKNKFFKTTTVLFALTAILSCSSDDKVIDIVDGGITNGGFLRTLEITSPSLDISDNSSFFGADLEYQDNEGSKLLSEVKVYADFTDNNGNGFSKPEALVKSIPGSTFTPGPPYNLPQASIQVTLGEMLTALGIQAGQYNGSDVFGIRLEAVLTDGRTFSKDDANGNIAGLGGYYSSPYAYSAALVCPPVPPADGDWTISMEDAYGDSWNGASLTITLDGTPYEFLVDDVEATSSVETLNVPAGTQVISIIFNSGSFNAEVGFTITSANGNVILTQTPYTTNPAVGLELIDYCVTNY